MKGEKMSTTAGTGKIRCPFFIASAKKEIHCEGYCAGMEKTIIRFEDDEAKREYKKMCCANDYAQCELYEVILEKYGEKGLRG